MIRRLCLNNLVLIDACQIEFGTGFHVITGETGAGKTALIEAISLALGNRADSEMIRKGSDRADVEIVFDIEKVPLVKAILEEAGLDEQPELVIRREISKEGKNRAFVNCRLVPLPLIQKIGSLLIDLIDQHAHQALRHSESQRTLVDRFGSLEPYVQEFQSCFENEKKCVTQLEKLKELNVRREKEEDIWRFQLEEIQNVALKKDEESELFEKYQKVAKSGELVGKIDLILNLLHENEKAVIPQVSKCIKGIDSLLGYDKELSEVSSLLHESHIALTETKCSLESYVQNLESDPKLLDYLENRLSAIAKLKKKYGQTFEEIEESKAQLENDLGCLGRIAEELQCAENAVKVAQQQTNSAASQLTALRTSAALDLQNALTEQLQELNMPNSEVQISVTPSNRHLFGDDTVQFWLKANVGEHPGLVKEHASGGELSRLLFAIKIVFAEKDNIPTLLFDEIDANVGGTTASIIGEKLKRLGKYRQIICITHFPQVASQADLHFTVQKILSEGRTKTQIAGLQADQREQELLRMIGGKPLV